MSTWQILSDDGNTFRWETSGRVIQSKREPLLNKSPTPSHDPRPCLPSMAELLLQGSSKLLENVDEGFGTTPMFRTGLGKSVVLKESSIAKALSVLGDTGEELSGHNKKSFPNSLFQTGSGKMVNVSASGLVRAKTLLRLEEDTNNYSFERPQNIRPMSTAHEPYSQCSLSPLDMRKGDSRNVAVASVPRSLSISKAGLGGSKLKDEVNLSLMQAEMLSATPKLPPIKFHTAGGRSLSVSGDALQRARSLLADPDVETFLDEGVSDDMAISFFKRQRFDNILSKNENDSCTSFSGQGSAKGKYMPKSFISPLHFSSSKQVRLSANMENTISGSNLMEKFDAVDHENLCGLNHGMSSPQKPLSERSYASDIVNDKSLAGPVDSRINQPGRSSSGPLVDISNNIGMHHVHTLNERKRFGKISSTSPFKRPRSSKFCTPLKKNVTSVPNGLSTLSSEHSCYRRTIFPKYPFQISRIYVREYFQVPPYAQNKLEHLADGLGSIKSENADKYLFCDESGVNCIGADTFSEMLVRFGASIGCITNEWVRNHYKWIVWKLACYQRCYPAKSAGKFLTMSNVLEELNYRYEREVNHGHRSAIKRILEGDASPSSMMVLCISSIHLNSRAKNESPSMELNGVEDSNAAKVELTDGWYSMDALLDTLLSKQLVAGKLFIGQKLQIWGAGICGWVAPVSPLEASRTVSLLLHINGTYRAHWAARLGFCKGLCDPLAFRCIKSNGGPVARTLVGVTRIYPVLYKERSSDGGSIVRSERMETKIMQLYNQRRSNLIESIVSEFQRGNKGSLVYDDSDSEEGAKLLKVLETAAEPEVIMAEMSPEQLTSFASYQAKLEAARQTNMEKTIEKALRDSGLCKREVIPLMRVRVVGLTSVSYKGKDILKEGLITIWNPTQKQQSELVEGQAYAISGLAPLNSDSDTLYLQARGSTIKWQRLSSLAIKHFKPFCSPRKLVSLSYLGKVPLSSEFDIAAFVVYVGEVHTSTHQKKQWVFVTDGSISESEELSHSLLAISFCSPCADDSFAPINHNLAGSTVGFCNLIKRAKDQINNVWVAEATENSTYFLHFDAPYCSHLKSSAASSERWAKISSLFIDRLRKKVLFIIGDRKR